MKPLSKRRPGWSRILVALVASTTIVVGLVAGAASGSSKPLKSKALTTLTFALASNAGNLELPVYAQEYGFFKKEGITAKISILNGGTILQALVGGSIDYAVGEGPEPEEGVLEGEPMKWISMWDLENPLELVAAPGINNLKELAGKPVSTTSIGSTTETVLGLALKKAGVALSQVKVVPLGSQASESAAFESGEVDDDIATPPTTNELIAARPGSKVIYNFASSKFPYPSGGIYAMNSFVASHRAITVKMLIALRNAQESWDHNKTNAELTIVTESPGTTLGVALDGWKLDVAVSNLSMLDTVAAEKNSIESLSNFSQFASLAAKASVREMYNNSLMEEADKDDPHP